MNVMSNSPYLRVMGGTNPWVNMDRPSAGMVRWNGSSSQIEVYDGSSWLTLQQNWTIETAEELNTVIGWAKEKMQEESKLKQLCQQFPALQKAYDNLEVIKAMVQHENIKV